MRIRYSNEKVVSSGPNVLWLNLENTYQLLWRPHTTLMHLLNLKDTSLFSLRTPLVETGQIERC